MKNKKIINKILKDPKHYLGWALTTGAVISLMHLLQIHAIHSSFKNILLLYLVIMGVDLFKHKFELQ